MCNLVPPNIFDYNLITAQIYAMVCSDLDWIVSHLGLLHQQSFVVIVWMDLHITKTLPAS